MHRPKSEPKDRKAEQCLCLGGSAFSLQRLGALVPSYLFHNRSWAPCPLGSSWGLWVERSPPVGVNL